jgi:CBS domain-containing protein
MKLADIMTRSVEVVSPSAKLRDAARKMRDFDVGAVPVREGDRLVGIVTDRDIAIRAVAEGLDSNTTVAEIMSREVHTAKADEDVEVAAKQMAEKQIRRLVVFDGEQHLAGIVSLGDLAIGVDKPTMVGVVLENVSQPGHETR